MTKRNLQLRAVWYGDDWAHSTPLESVDDECIRLGPPHAWGVYEHLPNGDGWLWLEDFPCPTVAQAYINELGAQP